MYSTIRSSPPSCGTIVADGGAVAQDRRAVARRDHLGEAVRDEEDRAAPFALRAHDREDALGEVGRQRGGDLVEQQQLRLARERAREVDHALHRQRHVAGQLREVDVEVHLAQAVARTARASTSA